MSTMTHRSRRSEPGVDARRGARAQGAVLWLADVSLQQWDLLEQFVLCQVPAPLPCSKARWRFSIEALMHVDCAAVHTSARQLVPPIPMSHT
jgi:hypothetical protein